MGRVRLTRLALGAALATTVATGAAEASSFKILYQFDPSTSADPNPGLSANNGVLYGTTVLNNMVFSFDLATQTETEIAHPSDGAGGFQPNSAVTLVGSNLYGNTAHGGEEFNCPAGCGVVYAANINTPGAAWTPVHAFTDQLAPDGIVGGPRLTVLNGVLFGTTVLGGANGFGTIYSWNTKTLTYSVVYSFKSGADGSNPRTNLVVSKGILYGTTTSGGSGGNGTVFSFDPTTGVETVLHSFAGGKEGSSPVGVSVSGSTLYGTLSSGGDATCNCGALFKLSLKTNKSTTLYRFGGSAGDGTSPSVGGPAIINGVLYGSTSGGGSAGYGTLFSYNVSSKTEKVEYSFTGGADGTAPGSQPIAYNGVVYGTNEGSIGFSPLNSGVIYQLTP